jgi:geranylgeranyl pyrophosphate synthase
MDASEFGELLGIADLGYALVDVADQLTVALQGTPELAVPSERMLNAGGKRLRPLLTIAAASICEPSISIKPLDDRVRHGAASVELVHVGSLVHDDILDRAKSRRGVPTVNAVEGDDQALLVGDFLLARAGVEAAHVSKDVAMSLAITIADLCDGQSLESVWQSRPERTVEDAILSIRGKTGALMRAACDIGAYCVGANEYAPALADFGMNFGCAFQLVDDLLDLTSTAELMGKPVNNDVKAGVYTAPMLFGVDRLDDSAAARRLMARAATDEQAADEFRRLVLSTNAVALTLDLIEDYNERATFALSSLPAGPTKDGLAILPKAYLDEIWLEKSVTS